MALLAPVRSYILSVPDDTEIVSDCKVRKKSPSRTRHQEHEPLAHGHRRHAEKLHRLSP